MKTHRSIHNVFAVALFALAVLALSASSAMAAEDPAELMTLAETVDAEVDCLAADIAAADGTAEPVEDLDGLFDAQMQSCDPVCEASCEQSRQECLAGSKCSNPSSPFCGCNLGYQICMNLCCG